MRCGVNTLTGLDNSKAKIYWLTLIIGEHFACFVLCSFTGTYSNLYNRPKIISDPPKVRCTVFFTALSRGLYWSSLNWLIGCFLFSCREGGWVSKRIPGPRMSCPIWVPVGGYWALTTGLGVSAQAHSSVPEVWHPAGRPAREEPDSQAGGAHGEDQRLGPASRIHTAPEQGGVQGGEEGQETGHQRRAQGGPAMCLRNPAIGCDTAVAFRHYL